jgi:hypothetical protein
MSTTPSQSQARPLHIQLPGLESWCWQCNSQYAQFWQSSADIAQPAAGWIILSSCSLHGNPQQLTERKKQKCHVRRRCLNWLRMTARNARSRLSELEVGCT